MKRALLLVVALVALIGAVAPEAAVEEVVVSANPLMELDRDIDRSPVEGEVLEALAAGPYRYIFVRTEAGDAWFVGLDKGTSAGQHVSLTPVGLARGFESRRLGRRFEALTFAVVTLRPPAGA